MREGPRLGHSIGGHHAKGLLFVLMGKHRSFHESKTYERVVSLLNKTSLTVMAPQLEVFVWIAQAVYGPSQDDHADKTRGYGERSSTANNSGTSGGSSCQ